MSPDVVLVDLLGLVAIAAIAWYFFLSRRPEALATRLQDGVQEIRVTVKGGYSPDVILAQPDVPLCLVFDRQEESPCSEEVVFPQFGVRRSLPAFETTRIHLPATPPGSYAFACGMNMLHGTLVVSSSPADVQAARAGRSAEAVRPAASGEVDPICGMTVEPERAAASSVRDGRTLYFCSAGCRERFEAGLGPRPMPEQRVTLGVRRPPAKPRT